MCVNSVFHKLNFNNSISSDLSTLFEYSNLALFHSLDIVVKPNPTLLLSTELILSVPGLILSLLN